jgi:hypothetical protein
VVRRERDWLLATGALVETQRRRVLGVGLGLALMLAAALGYAVGMMSCLNP